MLQRTKRLTGVIICLLHLGVLPTTIKAQTFDWETLPPTEPAKIWKINQNRQLETFIQPSQMAAFTETKRITVVIESVVINDKRDLFSNDAEVAIISRWAEGGGASDPMLVGLVQVSEGKAAVVKVPVTGPRYWTGVNSYDLRLEMWEIDDEKVSAMLGSQKLQYANVKDQLRGITGSLTSAAVTPHEAALSALIQPLLMAIVKYIEKPDKLFRSRVELTTAPQPGGTAVLPLTPGRYVIEYQVPNRTKRVLAAGMALQDDFSLTQRPSGGGPISNYLVLRIDVTDAGEGTQAEQDARRRIAEFRNNIRVQAGNLLPEMIRNLVPTSTTPIDEIIGQLELSDLKKRYEIRRFRSTDENKIKALEWFIDQVRDGRVPIGVGDTTPLFTTNQVRDAVNFVSKLVTGVRPVLDTDEPDEVLNAWRGLVKSASATAGRPSRVFSVDGSTFRLEKGLDDWYFEGKLVPLLNNAVTNQSLSPDSVNQVKRALRQYLETVEITTPDNRLTADERRQVLTKFRTLFEGAEIQPPIATGSAAAQAQTYLEWLKDKNLYVEVVSASTQTQPSVLRAGDWTRALLKHVDAKLTELANPNGTANPALFTQVIKPILQAMESSEGPFTSPEAKQKLANWLKDHTDADMKTDVAAWREYFAAFPTTLTSRDVAGRITIIRPDAFNNRLRIVQEAVTGLLRAGQQTSTPLVGNPVRGALQEATAIFESAPLTPQQERKLLDLFEAVGQVFGSKSQYLDLINERQGSTFLVTFREGQLVSGRPNYFSGPSIIESLQGIVNMTNEERERQLRRAVAFITSDSGLADTRSRQTILDLLIGPQGLTDFSASEADQFASKAWRYWLVESKPIWHPEVRRYIRSNQPPTG